MNYFLFQAQNDEIFLANSLNIIMVFKKLFRALQKRLLLMYFDIYINAVVTPETDYFKGIVHFEINFWYVLSYLKGIQDVSVFFSTVFSILIFFGQTVVVYQSYNGALTSKSMHREVQIKHDLMTRECKYTLMA